MGVERGVAVRVAGGLEGLAVPASKFAPINAGICANFHAIFFTRLGGIKFSFRNKFKICIWL